MIASYGSRLISNGLTTAMCCPINKLPDYFFNKLFYEPIIPHSRSTLQQKQKLHNITLFYLWHNTHRLIILPRCDNILDFYSVTVLWEMLNTGFAVLELVLCQAFSRRRICSVLEDSKKRLEYLQILEEVINCMFAVRHCSVYGFI